ncbi:MAG: hypothetical protein AAFN30_11100 [Actinomycetota bacterium]
MSRTQRHAAIAALLCMLTGVACSADSSSAARPVPDPDLAHEPATPPEPVVFATGTVAWGAAADERFRYEIEEVIGFAYSVTARADGDGRHSVRSANRQGPDDVVWLSVMVFSSDAPALVFGGVDPMVEGLVLRNRNAEDGAPLDGAASDDELSVTPITLPDRDWSLITVELPASWSADGGFDLEAIARSATSPDSSDRLTSR